MSKILIGLSACTTSFLVLGLSALVKKDFRYRKKALLPHRNYGKEIEPIRKWQSQNFIVRLFTHPHD
jgi:hypothetical protein